MAKIDELAPIAYTILQLIPIGKVTTYGSLARVLGTSPRVVGRLMALNPNPVIVPCHRVVMSDGSLGGYNRGGPRIKRMLLEAEGVTFDKRGRVRRSHILYVDKMLLNVALLPEDLGQPQPPEVENHGGEGYG